MPAPLPVSTTPSCLHQENETHQDTIEQYLSSKEKKNSTNNRKDPPPKENRLSRGRKDVRFLCATRLFCMSNFSCGSLRMFREANWDIHLMPLRHLAQKQVSVGFVSPNSGLPSPTPVPFLKENSFNGFSASFFLKYTYLNQLLLKYI